MKSVRFSLWILPCLLLMGASLASAGDSDNPSVNLKSRDKAFQKLDRDHDRLLTPQEWRSDVQTFLNLDCDRDQMVSREEYLFADCKMDRKEMAFLALDRNGNKVIELNEWSKDEEEFNRLDRDHDGILTRSELNPNKKSEILKQILGQIVVGP